MGAMEKELASLQVIKQEKDSGSTAYPSPPSIATSSPQDDARSNMSLRKDSDATATSVDGNTPLNDTVTLTPNKNSDIQATVTKNQQNLSWTLTVANGQLSIRTDVYTYSDLLTQLQHLFATIQQNSHLSPAFQSYFSINPLSNVLNLLIRRKYGKTQRHTAAISVKFRLPVETETTAVTTVTPTDVSLSATAIRLFNAYLQCQHLKHMAIHAQSFVRLTMDRAVSIGYSPAMMALSALVCALPCKHVTDVLPVATVTHYRDLYFNRAWDLVSEQFDDMSLDTFATYVFLANYKLALYHLDDARRYGAMAERLGNILGPTYIHSSPEQESLESCGERLLFKRLMSHLARLRISMDLLDRDYKHAEPVPHIPFDMCSLAHHHSKTPGYESASDESEEEKRWLLMHHYVSKLHKQVHEASCLTQSSDLEGLVGLMTHRCEMALRSWYNQLPPLFKLSLPIFDIDIADDVFFATLERECQHAIIPALTTLRLYEEYLVVGQSFLPKNPPTAEYEWKNLTKFWHGENSNERNKPRSYNEKWERRIQKLLALRKAIEFQGSDEEYLNMVNRTIRLHETNYSLPMVSLSVHAALNAVRLLQFLRSRNYPCHFEMTSLLNSWHVLLRVSKLRQQLPSSLQSLLPRIQANLFICLNMVLDECRLKLHEKKIRKMINSMEMELKDPSISPVLSQPVA
ncbi:uncharacterized protein BYT42DRAFT_555399 [Radiomyces spectabilis]|uniref:uncharacterized protein n=1 Tax=Radiomyces spectabilis TaxID=64574 RepID=UPI0022204F35|nr:uncharacterized protein BYT42DRAFT_555399 [Radiomyces spectabilis]KAI8391044.1 hypothetical protein BYT42DRAFT_555399 [Radiomyces spectabilis]